jgi:regulator of RNase E activity RraA
VPVGKRIYLRRNLPDPGLIEEFKTIPAANVADVMDRSCAMNPRIRLISRPKAPMSAGVALTVKGRAGDNLALHIAIDIAQEGDFIVVSNDADNTRSLTGGIMMAHLYSKKAAGIVLDGPIRDIDELGSWDFPIYATGATPGGPYKEGPGEINVPISCGEISVAPGDVILADADGIIVIPRNDAAVILQNAKNFQTQDSKKFEQAKNGSLDRAWVKKAITDKGFDVIDDVYPG